MALLSRPDGTARVLVVNAGSSSLKLRLLDPADRLVGSADLPAPRGVADGEALRTALDGLGAVDAVGHRVVHGGTQFLGPVRVSEAVIRRLEALSDLAPLHQPKSLAALAAVGAALPGVPAVACFDTAFHAAHAGGGGHVRAARRVAQALGPAPLRLSRPLAQLRSTPRRRARRARAGRSAPRELSSRRRGLARRRAGRPFGRHHHGFHPAGRSRDGDALGQRRPGPRAVARGARRHAAGRACRRPRVPRRPARPGRQPRHARGARGRGAGRPRGGAGRGRLPAPPARRRGCDGGRAGRARRPGLHRRRGRELGPDQAAGGTGPRFSGCRHRRRCGHRRWGGHGRR